MKKTMTFAIIRHGRGLLAVCILLPIILEVLAISLGDHTAFVVLTATAAILLIFSCWYLRKTLSLVFYKVMLNDEGVYAFHFGKLTAFIAWDHCVSVSNATMDTMHHLYDQKWLVFATDKQEKLKEKVLSLNNLPKPSSNCIYMIDTEFAHDLIRQKLNRKIWQSCLFRSVIDLSDCNTENDSFQYPIKQRSDGGLETGYSILVSVFAVGIIIICLGLATDIIRGRIPSTALLVLAPIAIADLFVFFYFLRKKLIIYTGAAKIKSMFEPSEAFSFSEIECKPVFDSLCVRFRFNGRQITVSTASKGARILLHRCLNEK